MISIWKVSIFRIKQTIKKKIKKKTKNIADSIGKYANGKTFRDKYIKDYKNL